VKAGQDHIGIPAGFGHGQQGFQATDTAAIIPNRQLPYFFNIIETDESRTGTAGICISSPNTVVAWVKLKRRFLTRFSGLTES